MLKPALTIKVEHPSITLELKDKQGNVVDQKKWKEKNNLSHTLLESIDKLLTRNKIEISQLAKVHVKTEQARYTSSRISKAVAQTVSYCLGLDSK